MNSPRLPLRIGAYTPDAPVVLAPMAGVTNAPFRAMCRRFGPGLVYVNEMVMVNAVVHRNTKTTQMMTFGPDEHPRSLQLYGSDPALVGQAVRQICDEGLVDHIDLNFGCPAAKVTRKGGGAAVPAKPNLLRALVRAAVSNAEPYNIPVTAKFRMGLWDDLRTDITTGQICRDEGITWIAMHARTVEQHYAGNARWEAIGELKAAVDNIPVLGNGDIWRAPDALAMMEQTGCDGVVIGRGALGRPWLFGDLVAVLNGHPAPPSRSLDEVANVMRDHAALLVQHYETHGDPKRARGTLENAAMRDFRKHTGWYLSGYPVGPEVRRDMSMVASLAELDELIGRFDPAAQLVYGGEHIRRGHTNGPIKVSLPEGFLDERADELANGSLDDGTYVIPDDAEVAALSGG